MSASTVTDVPDHAAGRRETVRLAVIVGALGVVFGDIGTSPIYTIQTVFNPADPHPVPIGQDNHRRIDRAGRRRTDQPHHRRLDLANGARPLRNLDGLNAMQKIRCHGQSPFFLLAGLVASVARRCR